MEHLREIYEYRQMIYSLVKRDLRGRYKGSVLGFLWTFVNPLLQLCVYTMVFSLIMQTNIDQYYIFLFVALVPWIFFSSSLVGGSNCIHASGDMVKKIYFPREVLPIAFVTSSFMNMLFSFVVVFAVLIVTGFGVNVEALLYLPIIMLVEYFLALGLTLIASALTVYFRDLEHILSIVVMAWQFLTPVMYSKEMVEAGFKDYPLLQQVWNMNPMYPIISCYRDILYYQKIPELETLGMASLTGVCGCLIGYIVFGKLQRRFAEEL